MLFTQPGERVLGVPLDHLPALRRRAPEHGGKELISSKRQYSSPLFSRLTPNNVGHVMLS